MIRLLQDTGKGHRLMNQVISQFQLFFAQRINKMIYMIIHFKPLEGLISEEWYVRSDIKRTLGIICLLWSGLKDILWKALYFLLVIVLPCGIFMNNAGTGAMAGMIVWVFFVLNCLMGSFTNSHIITNGDEQDYLLLDLMRIDAKNYYLTGIVWEYGKAAVCWGIAFFVILGHVYPGNTGIFLWVMLCYICCRPIGEAVSVFLCEHYGKIPYQEKSKEVRGGYYCYNFLMVVLAYALYPVLYLVQGMPKHIWHPLFDGGRFSVGLCVIILAAMAVGAAVAVKYLRSYPKYRHVARMLCSYQRVMEHQKEAENVTSIDTSLKDTLDEEIVAERIFPDKSGYEYLHAIFFERHKKIVARPSRIKAWIVEGLFGAAAVAVLVCRFVAPQAQFEELSNGIWKGLNAFLPILVFVMYCSSSGEKLTQAMFYHCDASLLKYGYYRTPEAIISSFRIRLRYMIRTECPFIVAFCVGVFVNMMLLGRFHNILQIIAVMCCIVILSVFFSVLFLCMYYIFQPFTESGNIVGAGYKICTMGIYMAAYVCLQIRTPPAYFAAFLLTITIFSMGMALLLVWKLAPKTFRLK